LNSESGPGRPDPPKVEGNHSKVIRHDGRFEWDQVPLEPYKATTESWKGITRRELIGKRGESPRFHVRYFELEPGGYSTLERHQHEHVVMVLRGKGEARFGCYVYRVGFGDVVYVAPGDPHQFLNPEGASEPFGFVCIVNAERDRPQSADGAGACFICE
jgi:ribulose-bisphosphate carboxylase large chain